MQIRNAFFLTIPLLIISFTQLTAQQVQIFSKPNKVDKNVQVETIVVRTKEQAAAMRDSIKKQEDLILVRKKRMTVPLAGEKTYFGPMNEFVVEYTRKYMSSHNRTLHHVQGKGNKHFSLIDNILQKHSLPKELKYLAVIESALNHNAISPVGAVGPWQFMESTARLMGLTVNTKRDERKDWYKSTNAAAKYLNYLYGELGDWLLVVAAYNSGPTPVQRAMQRTGSKSFWDIKKYLPKETQGHVLAFIATASIFEKLNPYIGGKIPESFSFHKSPEEEAESKKVPPKPKFSVEELNAMAIIRIKEKLNLDLISQDLNIERKILDRWNPDYEMFEMDAYEGEYYSLRIPKEKLDNFLDRKEFLAKRSKVLFSEMSM